MALFGPPNFNKLKSKGKTKELISYLHKYHEPEIQRGATLALGQMGPIAIEPLMAALGSSDRGTNAADALAMIGDARIVAPLLASFDDGKGSSSKYPSSQWDYQREDSPIKRALVKLGTAAVDPLVTALKEGNNSVRFHAAEILGLIGDPRAIPALTAALNDPDYEIREMITIALGQIGGPKAVEPLICALEDKGDQVKIAAERARGFHGNRIIRGCLVRKAAAEALGRIGDQRAIEPLSRALVTDDGQVLKTVASALDSCGWNPEGNANGAWYWVARMNWEKCLEIGNPAQDALNLVISEGWRGVTPYNGGTHSHLFTAIEIMGKIGDEIAVEPLILRLNAEYEEKSIRCAAAEALGRIGGPRAITALANALRDNVVHGAAKKALDNIGNIPVDYSLENLKSENPDFQRDAIAVLAVSRDPRAVDPLIALIDENPSEKVQSEAIRAIGKIGDPKAVEPLITLLNNDKPREVRLSAVWALGSIGDSRAVEPCIPLLQDNEHDIRVGAIRVLQSIKDERCMIPLIDVLLKDNDEYIRMWAVEALGLIGNDFALGPVAHVLLNDRDDHVRISAARSLGQFRNPAAITPLSFALNHNNHLVQYAAAEALGNIGDIQAVEPLIKALKDPYLETRTAAAHALVTINDPRTKDLLVKAFHEENPRIRQQALEGFEGINNKKASEPFLNVLR